MKKYIVGGFLLLVLSPTFAKEWYEGGTLHKAKAEAWCKADYGNKLATAGDWLASIWKNKKFTVEIQQQLTDSGIAGLKIMADHLVENIAAAICNKDTSIPEIKGEQVATVSAMLIMMMGWLKN